MARLVNGGKMLPNVELAVFWSAAGAAMLPLPAPVAYALLALLPIGVGLPVGQGCALAQCSPSRASSGCSCPRRGFAASQDSHDNFRIVAARALVLGEGTASLALAFIKSISGSLS